MSRRTTYYVTVFRRWNDRAKRWSTGMTTDDVMPVPHETTIAMFTVEVPTKTEAPAVVMEWLATGEPSAMTVHRFHGPGGRRDQGGAS
jgi:hypothetical protein